MKSQRGKRRDVRVIHTERGVVLVAVSVVVESRFKKKIKLRSGLIFATLPRFNVSVAGFLLLLNRWITCHSL